MPPHGAAWSILPMARSDIPAVSHDPLDVRSMRKSHIPQHPVVIFRQLGDGLPDLALPTPLGPPACDDAPDHGQPAGVDQPVSAHVARRHFATTSGGRYPLCQCSSFDSVFTLHHRQLGRCGRRNERNRLPSLAPGDFPEPPSADFAVRRCDRSGRKSVEGSAIEGIPLENEPQHRQPGLLRLRRCRPRFGSLRGWRQLFRKSVAPLAWCNIRGLSRGAATPDGRDRRLRIEHRLLRQIDDESRKFQRARRAGRAPPPNWCRLP